MIRAKFVVWSCVLLCGTSSLAGQAAEALGSAVIQKTRPEGESPEPRIHVGPEAIRAFELARRSGHAKAGASVEAILASDGMPDDRFGHDVAVSNGTAVIGAPRDDTTAGANAGSVYVFVNTSGTWAFQQKLAAVGLQAGDAFGTSVSIAGDTIVIGADGDDESTRTDSGAAYVFVRQNGTWSEQAKIFRSDGRTGDAFGRAVALSGDTVAIGAPMRDTAGGNDAGAVHLYFRAGVNWNEQATLLGSDSATLDTFGHAVAVKGDTLIVGAPNHLNGLFEAGVAYMFQRTGSSWQQQARLVGSDVTQTAHFGAAVALADSLAVVGAPEKDTTRGTAAGSVYVFQLLGTTWPEKDVIRAGDGAASDGFGSDVATDGAIVVGAAVRGDSASGPDTGAAYVFLLSGSSYAQQAKIARDDGIDGEAFGNAIAFDSSSLLAGSPQHTASTGRVTAFPFQSTVNTATQLASAALTGDLAGSSVATTAPVIAVGHPNASGAGGVEQGKVVVYRKVGMSHVIAPPELIASNPLAVAHFGAAVASSADGSLIAVGAPDWDDGPSLDEGAAYVFKRSGDAWSEVARLAITTGAAGDRFGASVAVTPDGSRIFIGAPGDSGSTGAIYVFDRGTHYMSAPASAKGAAAVPAPRRMDRPGGQIGDKFGTAIATTGTTVVVGAPGAATDTGAVAVIGQVGAPGESYAEISAAPLVAGDKPAFGTSVGIDGLDVLVGAPNMDVRDEFNAPVVNQGAAQVFGLAQAVVGTTTADQTITQAAGLSGDKFGTSIGVSGDTLAIGAPAGGNSLGLLYGYRGSRVGVPASDPNFWAESFIAEFGEDVDNQFGFSTSVRGRKIGVGAPREDVTGTDSGAAYLIEDVPFGDVVFAQGFE